MDCMKRGFDAFTFLTHAIWHCQYGSRAEERPATQADLQAAMILTGLRNSLPLKPKPSGAAPDPVCCLKHQEMGYNDGGFCAGAPKVTHA